MADIAFKRCIERAIEFEESWVINMIMNEKDNDLMFKRAVQAYEGNRELFRSELIDLDLEELKDVE